MKAIPATLRIMNPTRMVVTPDPSPAIHGLYQRGADCPKA